MRSPIVFLVFMLLLAGRLAAGWSSSTKAGILGITMQDANPTGARVTEITTVSPAVQAGVSVNDVITEVDGNPVRGAAALMNAIWTRLDVQKKDSVVLTIDRVGHRASAVLHRLPTYDNGFDPLPLRFPSAHRDYQILPGTISPDGRRAFIYPKRSRLYELKEYGLYLAKLRPFRILSQIPLGNSNLAGNARCYYAASWAKDATAAVFIAGGRWGPERVTVVQYRHGAAASQSDLTAAVRRQVRQDFRKSRLKPYNDYYDFVFDSEDRQAFVDDEVLAERGWDPDGAGHVNIDCTCTTDPKLIDPHHWAVHFKGVWDIQRGRFIAKKFTRVSAKPE